MMTSMMTTIGLELWLIPVCVLLLVFYVTRPSRVRLPPGPPNLPLIGSLPYLNGDPRVVFAKMAAKYGNVFTIHIGPVRVVVLNGYSIIKECLLKRGGDFEDRTDAWKDLGNTGISASNGHLWREQKRFGHQFLRTFSSHHGQLEDVVRKEISHLIPALEETNRTPTNIDDIMFRAIANVIATIATNTRYDYDDQQFQIYLKAVYDSTKYIGPDNPALIFKFLRYLPGDPFNYNKVLRIYQYEKETIRHWIAARRASSDSHNAGDLIGCYLSEIKKYASQTDAIFSEDKLTCMIMELFGAGVDTTACALTWILLYIISYPEVQLKVQKEIDDIVGPNRVPSMQNRKDMPYTEAMISEAQRLSDMLPLSVPRATTTDTTINGYSIPRGTMVIPNLHSVHWDAELWPNPDKFDPTRFLDEDGNYLKRDEFLPFSIGKRSCLGENLANIQLFLVTTSLLQRFTFSAPDNQPAPSIVGELGLSHHPKPFQVVISCRQKE